MKAVLTHQPTLAAELLDRICYDYPDTAPMLRMFEGNLLSIPDEELREYLKKIRCIIDELLYR